VLYALCLLGLLPVPPSLVRLVLMPLQTCRTWMILVSLLLIIYIYIYLKKGVLYVCMLFSSCAISYIYFGLKKNRYCLLLNLVS